MLYWGTRIALVAVWLVVALRTWPRAVAVCALVFASVRAFPWNYWLLEAARSGLRAIGIYEDRLWVKIVLAVVLVLVACTVAGRVLRHASSPLLRAGIGLHATLLAIETCSLDDALPTFCVTQPGRYLLEGAFASLALVGVLCSPPPREARS